MPVRRTLSPLLLALALVGSACAGSTDVPADAGTAAPSATAGGSGTTRPPATTTTTAPPPPTAVTTLPPVPPSQALAPACSGDPSLTAPGPVAAPEPLATVLAERLADPRFAQVTVGASVWVQGLGEVVAVNPDELLVPASGQKLVTAIGALTALDPYATFPTTVVATGPVVDGVVQGDLVLVGGGDPTLTLTGGHSVAALAQQVAAVGVRRVDGVVVNAGQPEVRDAGSGLPATPAGAALTSLLALSGIATLGPAVDGPAPASGYQLAARSSEPVWRLVNDMLLYSDNENAEELARTVGLVRRGERTTAAGLAAAHEAVTTLCVQLPGTSADGSGLSSQNRHSARSLRQLVQAALPSPWGYQLSAGLAVGGQAGTLLPRFGGTPAAGNVHAKTGSLNGVASLTGHLRTASNRLVVFSIIVNGPGAVEATEAIDELVVALAADTS